MTCKDFQWVHLLYAGAAEESWGEPNTLPIEGGHVIHDPGDANPPFLILNPDQVRTTATLLQTASFDARWHITGPQLSAQTGVLEWCGTSAKGSPPQRSKALGLRVLRLQ